MLPFRSQKARNLPQSPQKAYSRKAVTRLDPFEKCQLTLLERLIDLRDLNVLRYSLSPHDEASDFEILEFYGDSVLYEKVTYYIMQTRRFMSPNLLTKIRNSVINNRNLSEVFDNLGLQSLVGEELIIGLKPKADVVEAILGEMAETCQKNGLNLCIMTEIQGVLDKLLSYIFYCGEAYYFTMQYRQQQQSPQQHLASNQSSNQIPQQLRGLQEIRFLPFEDDTTGEEKAPTSVDNLKQESFTIKKKAYKKSLKEEKRSHSSVTRNGTESTTFFTESRTRSTSEEKIEHLFDFIDEESCSVCQVDKTSFNPSPELKDDIFFLS